MFWSFLTKLPILPGKDRKLLFQLLFWVTNIFPFDLFIKKPVQNLDLRNFSLTWVIFQQVEWFSKQFWVLRWFRTRVRQICVTCWVRHFSEGVSCSFEYATKKFTLDPLSQFHNKSINENSQIWTYAIFFQTTDYIEFVTPSFISWSSNPVIGKRT